MKFHKNHNYFNRQLLNELGNFLPSNIEAVQPENDEDETLYFRGPVTNSSVMLKREVRSSLAHAGEDERVSMQEVLAYSLASQVRTLFNPLPKDSDKNFHLVVSMDYLDGWFYLQGITKQLSTLRTQSVACMGCGG
jgi:hypothetical protein